MQAESSQTAKKPKIVEVDQARRLLNVEEVAAELGVSRFTVWRLCDEGRFPKAIKVGGRSRWSRADIDQFVAARGSAASAPRKRRKARSQ